MNATRSIESTPSVQGMRGGFAFSVGVHILILAMLIFGIPFFHSKKPDLPPMISVELVDIGKVTTTNKVSAANKVVKQPEEEKPAPPTPPPPESKPTPPQPTPPEPQPRPDIPSAPTLSSVAPDVAAMKVPDVTVKAQIPDAPKLTDVEPKLEELQTPKVDLKKPAPKENIDSVLNKLAKQTPPKPPAENFDSVLKNLTKQTPQKPSDQPPDPRAKNPPRPTTGANAPIAANLTASEMDALAQQLRQCWSLPATAKDAQDLAVDVDITVNPDRTLAAAPRVVDQGRMASDPAFRAAAMAATRALRMPQCSPLALPADKYQEWQSMTVHFDPKEMLGQ
jgi:outer membrane biosynthesis protein TonB